MYSPEVDWLSVITLSIGAVDRGGRLLDVESDVDAASESLWSPSRFISRGYEGKLFMYVSGGLLHSSFL